MNIKLLDYKVVETIFNPSEKILHLLDNISDMDMSQCEDIIRFHPFYLEEERDFFVLFELNLKNTNCASDEQEHEIEGIFSCKFIARFECDNVITDEFKNSNFPRVNAPAIAYPFLRAFVNNYFVNAGYNPVLLPTYNFTKFSKRPND